MAWNRGPTPSKHAHTSMRWLPEDKPVKTRAICDGCDQAWRLVEQRDGSGNPLWKWVVVAPGMDPGGQW